MLIQCNTIGAPAWQATNIKADGMTHVSCTVNVAVFGAVPAAQRSLNRKALVYFSAVGIGTCVHMCVHVSSKHDAIRTSIASIKVNT